jgi:uncharacterized membrane protein YfcA
MNQLGNDGYNCKLPIANFFRFGNKMTIVFYIVAGLGIGVISGLLGIGGGVLLVPVLVWLFKFQHTEAVGTTLAVLVPPIGLMAAIEYYRRGQVNLEAASIIAAAFVVGCYGGAKLVPLFQNNIQILRLLFGLMLLYIAVRFLLAADADVAGAFFGLMTVGMAWVGFFWLRLLGRRHRPRPNLADSIRTVQQLETSGTDYYI